MATGAAGGAGSAWLTWWTGCGGGSTLTGGVLSGFASVGVGWYVTAARNRWPTAGRVAALASCVPTVSWLTTQLQPPTRRRHRLAFNLSSVLATLPLSTTWP